MFFADVDEEEEVWPEVHETNGFVALPNLTVKRPCFRCFWRSVALQSQQSTFAKLNTENWHQIDLCDLKSASRSRTRRTTRE
jgi:hypothetical protein